MPIGGMKPLWSILQVGGNMKNDKISEGFGEAGE
jgi:hypothetical protein